MPTPKKRQRARRDVPMGWTWRDGRPRWIPSPTLRGQGWKGCDLKDKAGAWLGRGASLERAADIAAVVAGWRLDQAIDPAFADIAPAGSIAVRDAALVKPDRLSIGALIDAFLASDELAQKAQGTRRDYRGKLKRLVDVLAGHVVLPAAGDVEAKAAYAAAVAQVRLELVTTLAPVETEDGLVDLLHLAYWKLNKQVGKHQAYGVMAAASAWLAWCRERQSRSIRNWAAEIRRETPPGRINPLSWDVFKALVEAADRLGEFSMGDAIVLGVDLSWSQVDRLALKWDRVKEGRCMTARQKTGRVGGTPLTDLGLTRLAKIQARQAAMAAQPTHVLWCEERWRTAHRAKPALIRQAGPWNEDFYRKVFAKVREEAAKLCPEASTATDADLRDTAFTWAKEAELTDDGIASRTLQSRKNIAQLGDNHYGAIGPAIADPARDKLNAYYRAKGMVL